MSIFRGYDPGPWLAEKSLAALKEAVQLVDLANEPDTTPWYEKNLKHLASSLIGRLAPMVAFTHQTDETAVKYEEWKPICERGTFALAAWCKKWKVEDPHAFLQQVLAEEMDESELIEKLNSPEEAKPEKNEADSDSIKVWIYGSMMMRLMDKSLPIGSVRLLQWLLFGLRTSEYAATVIVNKKFLPTDIDLSIEETKAAYRDLYERGLIQRTTIPGIHSEALALCFVVSGVTDDNKHPAVFHEEEFGAPGIRIVGKPTTGNLLTLRIPAPLGALIHSWPTAGENRAALKLSLQEHIGEDRIYIETLKTENRENMIVINVSVRMPFDANDNDLSMEMEQIAIVWLKSKLIAQ